VSRLGPGDCFGEPSLLRDDLSDPFEQPASVVAVSNVRTWVLRRNDFRDVLLSGGLSGHCGATPGDSDGPGGSFASLHPPGMDRSLRGAIEPIREGVPEGAAAEETAGAAPLPRAADGQEPSSATTAARATASAGGTAAAGQQDGPTESPTGENE
jgi:hypothetical protein